MKYQQKKRDDIFYGYLECNEGPGILAGDSILLVYNQTKQEQKVRDGRGRKRVKR